MNVGSSTTIWILITRRKNDRLREEGAGYTVASCRRWLGSCKEGWDLDKNYWKIEWSKDYEVCPESELASSSKYWRNWLQVWKKKKYVYLVSWILRFGWFICCVSVFSFLSDCERCKAGPQNFNVKISACTMDGLDKKMVVNHLICTLVSAW